MNKNSVLALVVAALVFGFDPRPADAGPVTWQFSGEVVDFFDPNNILRGEVSQGASYDISFTFESNTPDSEPESSARGVYENAILSVSGHLADIALSSPSVSTSGIGVKDSSLGDNDILTAFALDIPFSGIDALVSRFSLVLSNPGGSAFQTDALPIIAPDLTMFEGSVAFFVNGGEALVGANVTALVPEPGSLALLTVAACWIVRRRRFCRPSHGALFILVACFATSGVVDAQWLPNYGPVIIGGDDMDCHRYAGGDIGPAQPSGDAFTREALRFLGAHVKNGNTTAVCIGCNGSSSLAPLEEGLAAGLPPNWTLENLADPADITAFFNNTGSIKIQNAGIVYIPSDREISSGITQNQIDKVNENAAALANFVKVDGGGLFTHTLFDLQNGYLWLQTLVPEIRAAAETFEAAIDELHLTCEGTDVFLTGLTDTEVADIVFATPWHNRFETAPGFTGLGGLTVVVRGKPPAEGPADIVVLAGPQSCGGTRTITACDSRLSRV